MNVNSPQPSWWHMVNSEKQPLIRHYLWCLALIGLIGFSFYLLKSPEVFPSASIELKLSKPQIQEKAEQWAARLGYKEQKPIKSTIFAYDDDAKTFLEYELGSTQANALMKQVIPIWYWSTRFCKELKQEEFTCWISPDGRLASFEHGIENDRALPSISHEDALTLAQRFVKEEAQQTLDGYKLIEQASVAQPHRVDHHFTWEDTTTSFKGARLRTHVYISGQSITAFNHYLYVPEKWTRKFSKLRSYNDALADAASIFYVALNTGTYFIFIWAFANGIIRWKFSFIVATVYALFSAAEAINGLPGQLHEYEPTMPFQGFELSLLFTTIISALGTYIQIFVLTASAEALYRKFFPDKIALERIFSNTGLRARATLDGLFSGTSTFGMHLGWIVLFYLAGRSLGLWCPLEVQNAESLSTTLPFLSALHVGFNASLTEELTYRVVGLIAFQRLVKNYWLANLLQAAAWAFMHSNYPQEPPYARGCELTVVGFLYGGIMKYFGVLPCIFSHNLIDTFLGLEPLFASSVPSLKISAVVGLLPFILLVGASIWLRKTKGVVDDQEALSNRALMPVVDPPAKHVAEELAPRGYLYQPLNRSTHIILAVLAVAFTLLQFFYYVPNVGEDATLTVSRAQAIEKARDYLVAHGIHPEGYSECASLVKGLDDEEMQYIFEYDKARLHELSTVPERALLWRIRFFKPLVQEEYLVLVDSNGQTMSLGLTMPENASGANLAKDESQAKVQAFIDKEHKEVQPYVFEDSTEHKREARTDYSFVFKTPKYKVGEADYKLTSECLGDRVSGYDHNWDIPDKWKFERKTVRLREQICKFIVIGIWFSFAIAFVWWAQGVLRSQAIVWRPAIIIGLAMAGINFIDSLNGFPEFFSEYTTVTPLVSFFVAHLVKELVSGISSFAMFAAMAAFALGALRLLLVDTTVPAILKTSFFPSTPQEKASSLNLWLDATILGFAVGMGLRLVWILLGHIHHLISPTVTVAPLDNLCNLVNLINPSLSTTIDAFSWGTRFLFAAAILVGVYSKYLRTPRGYIIFALAVSLIFPSQERFWQDYIIDVVNYWILFGAAYLFVTRLARENLLAYFMVGFISTIMGSMRILTKHATALYFDDLVFMTALMLSPVFYVLYTRINRKSKPSSTL